MVEGIAAKMEQGLDRRQAAFETMRELSGAVIATSLVLMAVFIPVSFFPGATGIMYRQFALIIIFSIGISLFNALSFTPSMSALFLHHADGEGRGPLGWFFRQFNRGFSWVLKQYEGLTKFLIRIRMFVVGVFILGLAATVFIYLSVPSGFVPDEDQGIIVGLIQAPDGVSLASTEKVTQTVYQTLKKEVPELSASLVIGGFGLNGNGPNQGTFFFNLKEWKEREGEEHSVKAIVQRLNSIFGQNQDALIFTSNLPAVSGYGVTGGFEFQLQDRSNGQLSIDQFLAIAQQLIAKANQNPALRQVFTQFTASTPQYEIDINRDRLEALDVDFSQAMSTLGAYMGRQYVNDFTFSQRSYRVYIHAVEQRLRPILMTTIASLCGFLPLVLSSGAGAASRTSLGTAVFGGLFISVIMSLLLVPVLYVVVKNLTDFGSKGKPPQSPEPTPSGDLASLNGKSQGTVVKFQGDVPA
ncbi:efflux RND transporter permease subunit [Nostoc sp.]|uniref:efflux RND transporter permease subunit n=1 Tax=Nostoc sp. TaxID=1180 RepID=UPI002FF9852C